MTENKSNMSYDTMLEMLIQNMKQLAANSTSSCNTINSTNSILVSMKNRIKDDQKISEESKEVLVSQIEELFNSIDENNNILFTHLSFLREQLNTYRMVCKKLKESGILHGDMSASMTFVEKSLSVGEKICQKQE